MRAALVAFLVLSWCGAAVAAGWGTITPGESTIASVRTAYGEPSSAAKKKVEKYDTTEWTYDGDRAPRGMNRMVVEFGLLTPTGYRPDVVRTFRLEPKPGVFPRGQVIIGWGKPDKGGTQDDVTFMMYSSGLVVYFDKDLINATAMVFTRPLQGTGSESAAPGPAAATPAPATKPAETKPTQPDKPKR
jgi:hypothetical protein